MNNNTNRTDSGHSTNGSKRQSLFLRSPQETFFDKLAHRARAVESLLCVGLDPHLTELPKEEQNADGAVKFCKRIIEATEKEVLAYKINAAFFEAFGSAGAEALEEVVNSISEHIPIIYDGKRGDIGSTADAYAAASRSLGVEAVTVNAYMGNDTLAPFTSDPARGVFVLCKTSNPSSAEIQELKVAEAYLYETVAHLAANKWNDKHNVGLVVGATDVEAIKNVRNVAPNMWMLVPGVGAQGGNLQKALRAGLISDGMGMIIPISRGISTAADPGKAANDYRVRVNKIRDEVQRKEEGIPSSKVVAPPFRRNFIKFALQHNVLQFGEFLLKSQRSGSLTFTIPSPRIAPYFFNMGSLCTGEALTRLGSFYASAIVGADPPLEFDVLFGPAYKGISLGAAVAQQLYLNHRKDVEFAYNRKEAKDHGEGGKIVGASLIGKRVLIVDDVITAGTAIREAIGIIKNEGADVSGVVVAVDRQEMGTTSHLSAVQQVNEEYGIPVVSIICLSDIMSYAHTNLDPVMVTKMKEFRERYGV